MIYYMNIPHELVPMEQWVAWKFEKREGKEKLTKVPYNPHDGTPAKSNDPSTWASFGAATNAIDVYNLDGIGFMFGNGIFGIDIDDCIDGETGEMESFATEIIESVKSYTELSPSKKGIHILCKGELPEGRRRKGKVEMYSSGRFFTVTGEAYGDVYPLEDCTERVKAVHAKFLADSEQPIKSSAQPIPYNVSPSSLSDEDLLQRAFASANGSKFRDLYNGNFSGYGIGDGSQSAADQAFCNLLAFWFGCDADRMDRVFRKSGLFRKKWDERRGKNLYGQNTIEKAIRDCKEVYKPQGNAGSVGSASSPRTPAPPNTASEEVPSSLKPNKQLAVKPLKFTWDDTGNGRRLRCYCLGEIKYNVIDGKWMVWDGKRWLVDEMVAIKRKADALLEDMKKAANQEEFDGQANYVKHIQKTRSSRGKENMIKECKHLEDIPVSPNELDRPGNVLNTQSGIVSLRTGNTRQHESGLLLSKIAGCSYDPLAKCPNWINFLREITLGDEELMKYLQCMAGYCLTASTKEQCVFFLLGNGSNGKSTFVDTLALLMGDYSANCLPETIMLRDRSGNARGDIARLKGVRMVTTSEPNDGNRLDEGTVKQMTGGTENKLTARFLYGEEFEFTPEFKIVMSTNYKPIIKGTDDGIWRRIRLIPFNVRIDDSKKDKHLPDKLKRELPGILNWAVQGSIEWYKKGMPKCQVVEAASLEYRSEMDTIQQFLDDCLLTSSTNNLQTSKLYACYKAWCTDRGDRYPIGANKFYSEMKKRFIMRKSKSYNEYVGITLNERGTRLMVYDKT